MKLVDLCIRRPVATTMFIAFLVVLGLFSYRQLAVDLFPERRLPDRHRHDDARAARASRRWRAASPSRSRKRSTPSRASTSCARRPAKGVSTVIVFFMLERNGDGGGAGGARQGRRPSLSQLPEGTDSPVVEKFDIERTPIMSIAVSGNRDLREVTEIAKKQIKEDIETQRGVGSVILVGGRERAINIVVDTDRLAAYGLSIDQVQGGDPGAEHRDARRPRRPGPEGAGPAHDGPHRARRGLPRPDRRQLAGPAAAHRRHRHASRTPYDEPRNLARLDGQPAVTLLRAEAVRHQHRRGHRHGQAAARDAAADPAARHRDRRSIRDQSRFIKRSIEEVKFHLVLAGDPGQPHGPALHRDWRAR